MNAVVSNVPAADLKLDLGCGRNKKQGFVGVDTFAMDGVDVVHDLRVSPWPWEDNSVSEVHCSHFIEHLTNFEGRWERVRFFNELHRILKPGGTCSLIFPHWNSSRFYGDPTHKEAMSEWTFFYLDRNWRLTLNNAPHADASINPNGYSCDFEWTYGYGVNPAFAAEGRNPAYTNFALQWWKEAATDIIATLKKR